ncbi:putative DNA-binding transcriptional regulator YafY [Haloferula luteola]|uniref:Putative DNA-binding transcriptional regulator YafY n=1 Tax=Haloferula luteola TaxID=595692 RepID=A0A840V1C3_9BACT|nr:WYL domain-containing protein [Haloferula luteola]MBB5352147.1 putative DNA-binding transcriptional regulator YafY [Haloferula luteola]
MHRIHQAILAGRLPNCRQLAEELEVTPKTVLRDITFMRDHFRVPLEYDERAHGYRYVGEVGDFPAFEVGEGELAALFLARHALTSIRGTEVADKLRGVFARLTGSLSERVELEWEDLDVAFSRKAPEVRGHDVQRFGRLADAVVKARWVSFHYRKLGADQSEARKVQPLHLGEVDGGWYLIAHDPLRGALRTFSLVRMSRVRVLSETFERPSDFDGAAYLRKSFGVWSGEGVEQVRVRLSGYAARMAQERRWHPTQEVEVIDEKGEEVEVRFEVGSLPEVVRWVLSFGSKAKVIEPLELKERVAEEVRLMR